MFSIGGDSKGQYFSNWGSSEFFRKVKTKITLITSFLEYGYNVLFVDADVILLKNPLPYLQSIQNETFIAQRDKNVCSGFMYIKSSKSTIDFMRYATIVAQNSTGCGDQGVILRCLKERPIPYHLLPDELFPSGKVFFEKYQYYWDRKGRRMMFSEL